MEKQSNHKISWGRIFLFFAIATIISNVFRFNVFHFKTTLETLPTWIFIVTSALLEGSGVLIGALIVIPILKNTRKTEMSFYGTSKSKSIIMASFLVALLILFGVKNKYGLENHIYASVASITTFLYCIMEEYGWRGYLMDELKPLKPWIKYTIIGLLWYIWHLSFLSGGSVNSNLFFLSMMIFGSWGIGQIAETTKSIVASACFHMVIQILLFNTLFRDGLSSTEKIIVLMITLPIWFLMIKKWPKKRLTKSIS